MCGLDSVGYNDGLLWTSRGHRRWGISWPVKLTSALWGLLYMEVVVKCWVISMWFLSQRNAFRVYIVH